MKIFIFILIFIPLNVLAHQDRFITIHKSNVFLQYQIGWEEHEIGNINEILAHLTEKLAKKRNFKEDIFISFIHDYVQWDSAYYALGYGKFNFVDYQNGKKLKECCSLHYSDGKNLNGSGIKLIMQDRKLDIQNVLSIIDNAISNLQLLKKTQNHLIIDKHHTINGTKQYDTLISIPWNQIDDFRKRTSNIVKDLINQRTYSNLEGPELFWSIDYYYQKNQFHFYNTSEPETEYNSKTGNDDTIKVFGEDILVVDNILEIFGNWNYGHFVFINDSVFYYIPKLKTNILGPHKIDSVRAGRPPIRRFDVNDNPMFRYTLFLDRYTNFSKALFIPDSNLLISNFDIVENHFIIDLISNSKSKKSSQKHSFPYVKLILIVLVGISILVNVYLGRILITRKT